MTEGAGMPLLMAPFGASCVLLFAVPNSPLSQPANVIGGHAVATLAGLALFAGVVQLLHRLRRRPPVDGDGAVL